jgi:hypothetical protein
MREILTNPTEFGKLEVRRKEERPLYSKRGFRVVDYFSILDWH